MFMINIGCICCAILALTFLFYYIICTCLKGLGVYRISAFKNVPREESHYYDKKRISRAQRSAFKKWFVILSIGTILSYYVSQYFAYIAIGLWALIFFKDILVKKENLFRNYRI